MKTAITFLFSLIIILCFSDSAATSADNVSCSAADGEALRLIIAEVLPAPLFASNYTNCCGRWNDAVSVSCRGQRITKLQVILGHSSSDQTNMPAVSLFPLAVCRLSALSSLSLVGDSSFNQPLLSGSIPSCLASNLSSLVHLDLSLNSLTGPIPTTFPPALQFLDLHNNHFTGIIPAQLFPIPQCSASKLSNLAYLDLSSNSLTGPIPAPQTSPIPNCLASNLVHLDLSFNSLTGPIPTTFPPALQFLDLNSNHFTGTIPTQLFSIPQCSASKLSSLVYLDLSSNNLTGPIPAPQTSPIPNCSASSLVHLDLSLNSLTGPIPTTFPPALQFLDLHNNQFTGTIPAQLFPIPQCSASKLSNLVYLDLSYNSLTGPIPAPQTSPIPNCSASNLVHLDLSSNSLTGPIPTIFSSALQSLRLSMNHFIGVLSAQAFPTSLQHLDLSLNELTGSIPPSISRLHSIISIDLSQNSLSEGFLAIFSNLDHDFPQLSLLSLSENALSGPIPSTFVSSNLTGLDLSGNSLSGPLPTFNTPSLESLDLSRNSLSGDISTFFESPTLIPSLYQLLLSSNGLQGSFPPTLCRLPNLSWLDLSDNLLTGQLNFQNCNASTLSNFLISGNQFSGPFPDWLGSTSYLLYLGLNNNHFNGSIPDNWRNLTSLQSLDLSGNSLIPRTPHGPKLPTWLFNLTSFISSLQIGSLQLQGRDLSFCSSSYGFAVPYLDLSNNLLTSKDLACFSNVTVSSYFNISGNPLGFEFGNPIAQKIFSLSYEFLDLGSCMLTGSLPTLFFNHLANSTIKSLYLGNNRLNGRLLIDLGNMSSSHNPPDGWVTLDLSRNNFTRLDLIAVGKQISNLNLFLSNNFLEGNFSSIFTCNGFITQLDLSHNFLTGSISHVMGQCFSSSTTRIKLNNNLLNSFIPQELFVGDHTALEVLSLSNNQLGGTIPSSFATLIGLVLLDLSHNMLEGTLNTIALFINPSPLYYAKLRVLNLGYNEFKGTIPTFLGTIAPDLQIIDFSNNHLVGTIPVQSFHSLRQFRHRSQTNSWSFSAGILHEEMNIVVKGQEEDFQYVIQALTSLDLSNNKLSGPMGSGMGELFGLTYLNVSRNSLSGPIPSNLGEIGSQLQSLDLSYNELSGSIPTSFQNLTLLEVFNVSYNTRLSGPIPENSPQLQNNESYIGDLGLCGDLTPLRSCPLATTPILYSQPSLQTNDATFPKKLARWFNEWIGIQGLVLGWVVGVLGGLWAFKHFTSSDVVPSS